MALFGARAAFPSQTAREGPTGSFSRPELIATARVGAATTCTPRLGHHHPARVLSVPEREAPHEAIADRASIATATVRARGIRAGGTATSVRLLVAHTPAWPRVDNASQQGVTAPLDTRSKTPVWPRPGAVCPYV